MGRCAHHRWRDPASMAELQCLRNSVTSNSPHLGKITLQERAGGISLAHSRYAPGVRLAAHTHEKACFVWIQNGGYAETFDTRVFQLRARQVLFRPAGEKHSDQFSSVETSCVIIEVSETWLDLVRECGRLGDSVAIHSLASAHRCVASPPISTSRPSKRTRQRLSRWRV